MRFIKENRSRVINGSSSSDIPRAELRVVERSQSSSPVELPVHRQSRLNIFPVNHDSLEYSLELMEHVYYKMLQLFVHVEQFIGIFLFDLTINTDI